LSQFMHLMGKESHWGAEDQAFHRAYEAEVEKTIKFKTRSSDLLDPYIESKRVDGSEPGEIAQAVAWLTESGYAGMQPGRMYTQWRSLVKQQRKPGACGRTASGIGPVRTSTTRSTRWRNCSSGWGMNECGRFRVVQPWGPDKARQATLISEHATAAEAFAEIDRLSAEMVRTGAPSDAVENAGGGRSWGARGSLRLRVGRRFVKPPPPRSKWISAEYKRLTEPNRRDVQKYIRRLLKAQEPRRPPAPSADVEIATARRTREIGRTARASP
jgi:hypothetical protein